MLGALTYQLEFSNEPKPDDQPFEDNDIRVVTDMRSVLYLFNTTLEFFWWAEGAHFPNPNASRTCCLWRKLFGLTICYVLS